MSSFFLFSLGIMAALFATAGTVQATIGEGVESIVSDGEALSANEVSASDHNGYSIREIKAVSVTVREYISPAGVVFGIAWNGLIHPDLEPLLGAYAGEYLQALRQQPPEPGSRRLLVKSKNLVVEKWGHMRDLRGRAYAPALIPQGVTIDEIN